MAKKINCSKSTAKYYIKNALIAVAAVFIFVSLALMLLSRVTRHGQKLEVPQFVNLSMEEAMDLADRNSLRLEITDSVHNHRLAPGAICKQNPEAGSFVKKNRRILLTINATTPKYIPAPSLTGFSLRQAISMLASCGLEVGELIYVTDIATNNVLEQYYNGRPLTPGSMIAEESRVDLKLGLNPEEEFTYMPKLKGVAYQNLREKLAEFSLNLGNLVFDSDVITYSDSLDSFVYRTIPSHSDSLHVRMGTRVSVYLTRNKEMLNWKEPAYKPDSFGTIDFPDDDSSTDSSDTLNLD